MPLKLWISMGLTLLLLFGFLFGLLAAIVEPCQDFYDESNSAFMGYPIKL